MECNKPIKSYQIILTDDRSDLAVQRIVMDGAYWYFVPEEKVWIKSTGLVVPGYINPNSEFEDGIIQDDKAALFRALIKLNQMIETITNELHDKTTLFKIQKDSINNVENKERKTTGSRNKPKQSDGPLSKISGISGS